MPRTQEYQLLLLSVETLWFMSSARRTGIKLRDCARCRAIYLCCYILLVFSPTFRSVGSEVFILQSCTRRISRLAESGATFSAARHPPKVIRDDSRNQFYHPLVSFYSRQ
jgi:hypothetical protein